MSEQGPTSDSYKMPLVVLAVGRRSLLRSGSLFQAENIFTTKTDELKDYAQFNAWEYIQSFSFEFSEDTPYVATFRLFDPDFDRLLLYFTTIRQQQQAGSDYSLFYRYGWMTDGNQQRMSPLCEGVINDILPEVTQDGLFLTVKVIQSTTQERMFAKVSASFDARTRPELIARALIELTPLELERIARITSANKIPYAEFLKSTLEQKALDSNRLPRVEIAVECEPWENSGQAILCKNQSPIGFIRQDVLANAVPSDPKKRDLKVKFIEKLGFPGVYIWTTEGTDMSGFSIIQAGIKRIYHVARGRLGNVIKFEPADLSLVANLLGGGGTERAIDASAPKGGQVSDATKPVTTNDPLRKSTDQSALYVGFNHARDLATLVQQRQVLYNKIVVASARATAEVLGDPTIQINTYVEFRVYAGGTISSAGRAPDVGSIASSPTSPVVVPSLSGVFVVTGFKHEISESGAFTTHLALTRSGLDLIKEASESQGLTSDTYGSSGTFESTFFVSPTVNA